MNRDALERLLHGLIDVYIDDDWEGDDNEYCSNTVLNDEESLEYYLIDPTHLTVEAMTILGLTFTLD